jgi:hypothetical protein
VTWYPSERDCGVEQGVALSGQWLAGQLPSTFGSTIHRAKGTEARPGGVGQVGEPLLHGGRPA